MITTVTVNGTKYNITRATAEKQLELDDIISQAIQASVANLTLAGSIVEVIDANHIRSVMNNMPAGTKKKVIDIVLWKTFVAGDGNEKVTFDNFKGEIHDLIMLASEGVCINLKGFIDWLMSQASLQRELMQKAKSAKEAEEAKLS